MCCRKKTLRTHYMQMSVNEWIEPFIANLGHPLWGSQSMQDLASLMRKGRTFQIPGAIPELTACPIKDDPDLQWRLYSFIHTHLHVMRSQCLFPTTHKVSKSPKSEANFWKECIKAKKWKTPVLSKSYPCTLICYALPKFDYHSWM